jgi:hypothetical protein
MDSNDQAIGETAVTIPTPALNPGLQGDVIQSSLKSAVDAAGDIPVLVPEPVPVPPHLEAAAALVTPESIVAASQDTGAPADARDAAIAALERRVAKLEERHFDFCDKVNTAFGGKL